jgi:hypothetical protein
MNDPNINTPTPPLTDFDNVTCDECGGITFTGLVIIKRIPALISPRGKEEFVPINTFKCDTCSSINDKFLEGVTI